MFSRILSRLINKAPTEISKESPIPPPGPFVIPHSNCNFTEIQPPFVNLTSNNQTKEDEKSDKKSDRHNGAIKEEPVGGEIRG